MHNPVILRVCFINLRNSRYTNYHDTLHQMCSRFESDSLLYVYKPAIVYVHLHPIACPRLEHARSCDSDQHVVGCYFKHSSGLSRVSKSSLGGLFHCLGCDNYAHRIRNVWYDARQGLFTDSKRRQRITGRKQIHCVDTVVSLLGAYQTHNNQFTNTNTKRIRSTTRGYVSSKHHAFYEERRARVLPAYQESQPNLSLPFDQPVQATDGPFENVAFQHLIRHEESLGQATPSRRHAQCRHPEYWEEQHRRESFHNWPHQPDLQDVDRLVRCGFYYTGTLDMVRCYQCGLGLKDWSYSDDPWLEHIRYSPHCLHTESALEPAILEQYRTTVTSGFHGNQTSSTEENATAFTYRHPEYVSLDARLRSFSKWPSSRVQTPAQLADAGFYYTGLSDQVRCYACDGGLQHWDTDDEPWVEHARWFAHCPHVRTSRGEMFIEMVQMAVQDSEDETDQDGMVALTENINTLGVDGASAGPLESDDPIYSPEAQKVILNLGFSKAAVRMVIQECTEKKMRWNADILASILLDKQSRGETLPPDSPRPGSPVEQDRTISKATTLEEERRSLIARLKCIMCEENDSNVLFLPCAHHRMCMECSKDAKICPVCCKEIKQHVRTYMA